MWDGLRSAAHTRGTIFIRSRTAPHLAAGLAGGALGIGLVTRVLRSRLYEVSPFDPIALGMAVLVLVACAAIALFVPLRRAMQADPVIALRAQ